MKETLQQQYSLLRRSREVVFNFIESEVGDGLNTQVAAYGNRTISNLLEHSVNCYLHWLVYFATHQPVGSIGDLDFTSLKLIRRQYARVDDIVGVFLEEFGDRINIPITGEHDSNGKLSATPLQLLTHVITHEFHHKGQILSMCRLLGHIPPDTDVSIFFDYEQ